MSHTLRQMRMLRYTRLTVTDKIENALSYYGGNRDGNLNVDTDTLECALLCQASVLLEHYLKEVHVLGAELAMANNNGDTSPYHSDKPYRGGPWSVSIRV